MKVETRMLVVLVLAGLLAATSVVAGDAYTLITEKEFAAELEAPNDDELFARAFENPLAPKIGILRPGTGSKYKAPIDIELKFEAADGSEIDIGTLKITYGSLGIDVTERVTEHATVTEGGLVSENAALPTGRHKLTVSISDTEGRVGKKRFKFQIVD